MTDERRAEAQALLVRSADIELCRQAARKAGNAEALRDLDAEHRRIWQRFAQVNDRERAA